MAEGAKSLNGMCDLCGVDVNGLGTRVDLEIFADEDRYVCHPVFCSWEHCTEWFARPEPDFTTWDLGPASESGGFQYGGLIVVVAVLSLAVVGLVSLVKGFCRT